MWLIFIPRPITHDDYQNAAETVCLKFQNLKDKLSMAFKHRNSRNAMVQTVRVAISDSLRSERYRVNINNGN